MTRNEMIPISSTWKLTENTESLLNHCLGESADSRMDILKGGGQRAREGNSL